MNLFNLFRKQQEPEPTVSPGEVYVERNWQDDYTDTTVITIGGQISSRQLVDIKAILEGRATAHRKPKRQEGGR